MTRWFHDDDGSLMVKRVLITILLSSLALHFVISAFFNQYSDLEYWYIIMQNVETGNSSYGLNGNFYTPVWGYLLSSMSMFLKYLGMTPQLCDQFPELAEVLYYTGCKMLQPTPLSSFLIKLPLSICDVLVGLSLFKAVERITGNQKRALFAAALWCFCPIVLFMTAVQAQFDSMSVLLLLIAVFLLIDDRSFLAGIALGYATWLKIFPGLCAAVMLFYIIAKHKGDGKAMSLSLMAILGFLVVTAVVFIPTILDGTFLYSFGFITSRGDNGGLSGMMHLLVTGAIAIAVTVLLCRSIAVKGRDCGEYHLFLYVAVMMTVANIIAAGYQYAPSIICFIILFICVNRSNYAYPLAYWVIGIVAFLEAIIWLNFGAVAMISAYTGIFGLSDLSSLMVNNSVLGFLTTNVNPFLQQVKSIATEILLFIVAVDLLRDEYPLFSRICGIFRLERDAQ